MTLKHTLMATAGAALLLGSLGMTALTLANPAQADNLLAQATGEPRGEGRGHGPRGQHLAEAAAELGVTEAALRTALGLPAEPVQIDLAAAATQLGTTETELRESLREARQAQGRRGGPPDLAPVAEQYGVSEAELRTALGLPAEPLARPDLATAAR
ncbi:MAG: hypothetical protein HC929_14105 [Leptolyngbyaceae cyanobacterium SM2_5_2]|nr:hypothetical protein [Leptolyngbyaceae cyanobacterium SM2_5_2]